MARFRVTAADGSSVEVKAIDWMMAMSVAIRQLGTESSGWVCDSRPNGDTLVTDSKSGATWVVHPLDPDHDPSEVTTPPPAGPPPVPPWLAKGGGFAKPRLVEAPPEPKPQPKAKAAPALPKREPLPIEPPPRRELNTPSPAVSKGGRGGFGERAREASGRAPSPEAPNPRWAHRGQVPPPRRRGAKRASQPGSDAPPELPSAAPPAPEAEPPAKDKLAPSTATPQPLKKGNKRLADTLTPPDDMAERLFEASMDITGAPDKNSACSAALEIALDIVKCEAGSVLRGTINDTALTFVAVSGPVGDKLLGVKVPFGKGLAGVAFDMGITVVVNDAQADARHDKDFDKKTGFQTRSILCVPVRTDDGFYGCIQLLNPALGFRPWHVEAVESLATTLATTLARF